MPRPIEYSRHAEILVLHLESSTILEREAERELLLSGAGGKAIEAIGHGFAGFLETNDKGFDVCFCDGFGLEVEEEGFMVGGEGEEDMSCDI